MKIRTSFVSNSSTSSFIIYGFDVSDTDIDNCFQGSDDGLRSGQKVVGEMISWEEGDCPSPPSLDFKEIEKNLEKIRKQHKLSKKLPWKIFYGTRFC